MSPDSPEGVAYALLSLIIEQDGLATAEGIEGLARNRVLDLYRDCLRAVIGDEVMDATTRH